MSREFKPKQLAQSRPADTNAASIYSPATGVIAIVKNVHVANSTGTAATFRIFIDNDGTTYDQTTAIAYDFSCPANGIVQIEGWYPMDNASGNLAVRTGTSSALTFTVNGEEK